MLPPMRPKPTDDGRRVVYPVGDEDLPAALREFLAQAAAGDYVALQAYVAPGQAVWDQMQAIRLQLRDGLRVATTLGYGPRYLHSTGQLHKGGPNTGLFLQLLGHDLVDRLLGGVAVGQHQPDDARLRQRGHDAGQFADGLGAFGAELLRLGEGAVPY